MAKKHSTEDDAVAFRDAVRDVKPLTHVAPARGLVKPKPRARRRAPGAVPEDLEAAMPLVAPSASSGPDGAPVGAALSFHRPGVRTQVVRRLRRGLIPVEDEIDLHGLNQAAARDRLAQFLANSRALGRRCVRVIHGKGYRSGARGPVLKIAVDLWLRRHFDVMAFTSARALDGGTGAVYVLLRA